MSLVDLNFLGWDSPPLASASGWLLDNLGPDMGGWTVALPGSRAVRNLRLELLREARSRGVTLQAPRIVTIGALTDLLVGGEGRVASSLVRRLCWEGALRQASDQERGCLGAQSSQGDLSGIAAQMRGLHSDLVAADLTVEQVQEAECLQSRLTELERWRAFGQVQNAYRSLLAGLGLVDPHDRRRLALAQRAGAEIDVIMVGIASQEPLRAAALDHGTGTVKHLVVAPESLRDLFDKQGCLLSESWIQRKHRVSAENWSVVSDPRSQAQRVIEVAHAASISSDGDITVGIGDSKGIPDLIAGFAAHGVEVRDAAGACAARSMEGSLIKLLSAYCKDGDVASIADLWRHPWIESFLSAEATGALVGDLDSYRSEHLPQDLDGPLRSSGHRRSNERNQRIEEALVTMRQLLGPISEARGSAAVCAAFRGLLVKLLGDRELDADDSNDRDRVVILRALGSCLVEIDELPSGLELGEDPHEVLQRIHDELSERRIAPGPKDQETPAVDLLGWLELLFDSAPLLVVTSAVEGCIPSGSAPDSVLPEPLRRELGLETQEDRLARDFYTAEVLDQSRHTHWITPHWASAGDPFLPSRLLLRVPNAELPAQVRRWINEGKVAPTQGLVPPPGGQRVRLAAPWKPDVFSVTGFKLWLDAPYLYHLGRELGWQHLDDRERELSAAGFGNLVHRALEVLGREDLRACSDEEKIREALRSAVYASAEKYVGRDPLPAVALQVEQAVNRVAAFAPVHAGRVADGWRIKHVEWEPADRGKVSIPAPDGPAFLRGRIDRIEQHADGRWALLDYKTGSTKKSPNRAHRKAGEKARVYDGEWLDLQLPLYTHLARELIGGDEPVLGYFWLGQDKKNTAYLELTSDEGYLKEALEKAGELIRDIRSGVVPDTREGYKPYSELGRFLVGHDLALEGEDEE